MTAHEQVSALAALEKHPGFALLCAKFAKEQDAVRELAMDAMTDDEANKLRFAHKKLSEFRPDKLRDAAYAIAKREADKG